MAYIYVITNELNLKQYVGKTNVSLQARFNRHIIDSKRDECKNRPLYRAFNKYGIENFKINLLEECPASESSNREKYWINELNTYHSGYNATLGGEGIQTQNYKEIYEYWKTGKLYSEIQEKFHCTPKTIQLALNEYEVPVIDRVIQGNKNSASKENRIPYEEGMYKDYQIPEKRKERKSPNRGKPKQAVAMIDKDTEEIIQIFESKSAANLFLGKYKTDSSITYVCQGKRKTAWGYKWKFVKDLQN